MEIPSKLFVDTSFFIALLNKDDNDHTQALALQGQLATQTFRKYTSEYVLLELGDGLSRLRFRHLAIQLIDFVYSDATFEIVPASSDRFIKAHTLFKHRPDKEWGLTDCTSFVIMQEFGLEAALTVDHHFQQAGFRALLLEVGD